MKVVLDLSQLLEDGEITQAEADKLKRLSVKSTGSLAFNILIGFGVIAVAIGTIALIPDALTGIVLGAIVLGFGLVLLHYSRLEWGVLGNICVILGALGLGGGVVYMTEGSVWAFLGGAIGFAIAGVIARSGLLIALSRARALFRARCAYRLFSRELLPRHQGAFAYDCCLQPADARLPIRFRFWCRRPYTSGWRLMAARVSILLVNFGFWIGSLWGDRLEQLSGFFGGEGSHDSPPGIRDRLGAGADRLCNLGDEERSPLGSECLRCVRRNSFLYAVLRAARTQPARDPDRRRFRARHCDRDLAVQQEGGGESVVMRRSVVSLVSSGARARPEFLPRRQ
jgi:hypothetical protein